MKKPLYSYVGYRLELLEMPQLSSHFGGNPNVTVGNEYFICDVEGSNFWLIDDDGNKTTFGSSRFNLD